MLRDGKLSAGDLLPNDHVRDPTKVIPWVTGYKTAGYVSDAVEIRQSPERGWGVFAKKAIQHDAIIFSLDKNVLLTRRNSRVLIDVSIEEWDPHPKFKTVKTKRHHEMRLLALALLFEIRQRDRSPWRDYLLTLPCEVDLLPIFWPMDGRAMTWLDGTNAAEELKDRQITIQTSFELEKFFTTCVRSGMFPHTTYHQSKPKFSEFAWAYTIASTRCFSIDDYHHLGFVPFADMLNHSSRRDTLLSCDDFVCPHCGSLKRCRHDVVKLFNGRTDMPERLKHLTMTSWANIEADHGDTVEMRAEHPIEAGQEIFNGYGDAAGDSELLIDYGFVEGEYTGETGVICSKDVVFWPGEWTKREAWESVMRRGTVFAKCLPDRTTCKRRKISSDDSPDITSLIAPPLTLRESTDMYITDEGVISFSLFAAGVARGMQHTESAERDSKELEATISAVCTELAGILGADPDGSKQASPSRSLGAAVWHICEILAEKEKGYHCPNETAESLLDFRDTLKEDQRLLRMALTISIDERTVVRAAIQTWSDLMEQVQEAHEAADRAEDEVEGK